jgi:hypothetical protein
MQVQIVFAGILAVSILNAQPAAALCGRVSAGDVPVANAIVTVSNPAFLKSVTTDDKGRFAVEQLPSGRYDFRASVPGYAIFERSVVVRLNDPHRNWIDVKDLVPADQQTVSVAHLAARKQGHRFSRWSPLAGVHSRLPDLNSPPSAQWDLWPADGISLDSPKNQ